MNKIWETYLQQDLEKKQAQDQLRVLKVLKASSERIIRIKEREFINFASNDYLGLAHDKRLTDAGCSVAAEWGAGAAASRLISGTYEPITRLEAELADWAGKESCLLFNSGYNANIGLLSSLADRDTVIFCDRLNHASIYDGALLSGAVLARYRHCDMDALRKLLKRYRDAARKIIITDTVFSMDGDLAPLPALVELAEEHKCLLIVDEAHSVGLFGDNGGGLTAALGLTARIDVIMGTLGKACGVFGAYAASSRLMISYLVNNCRSFIFTTALPPYVAGALLEALAIIRSGTRGRATLEKAAALRSRLQQIGINCGESASQVIPVILGPNEMAIRFMDYLMVNGIFAPAVRPPAVPLNTARVRLSVSYAHTEADLDKLFAAIKAWQQADTGEKA